jgi:Secretion system C-terminal sorting domain
LESVNANASPKIKSDNDLVIEQISFYPNPNEGLLNLNFTTQDKAPIKVFIYDTLGNVVYAEEVNQFSGSYKNQIDISAQPVGSYFLQIVQGQKTYSKKIAKGQ